MNRDIKSFKARSRRIAQARRELRPKAKKGLSTDDSHSSRSSVDNSTDVSLESLVISTPATSDSEDDGFGLAVSTPTMPLSQSRRDPFLTYPITWDPGLDALFDSLTHDFGPSMFDYLQNSSHDIFRSQANLVLSDPAAFHALMIMPAMNRDRLSSRLLPSARTLWHRSEAIRLIKERMEEDVSKCMTECFIFTVMCLTGIEKQWHGIGLDVGDTGLQRLIIRFGGLTKLHEHYPTLELGLYGLTLMTPGMLSAGSPALYDAAKTPVSPEEELKGLKAELGAFLKAVETRFTNSSHDLRFALSPGTSMYELLLSPPRLSGILQSQMETVQRRLCNCAILYLHCVILGLESDDSWTEFFRNLHSINQTQWIWSKSSRMLQWMLITNGGQPRLASPDSAWKAFRLVNAIELLSAPTQARVKEYLIRALSGPQAPQYEVSRSHDSVEQGDKKG